MLNQSIKTKPIKGFVIFLVIVILFSVLATLLGIFIGEIDAMKVMIFIFSGIFFIASSIALIDQLFHYVVVDKDYIKTRIWFKNKRMKLSSIKRITLESGSYCIYSKKGKFATIPAHLKEARDIIIFLDKLGFGVENT